MLDDLFVWTKIKEGDIKTFEQVFKLYYSSLCFYASGITGSRDAAEEIVQNLFYTLWKERDSLQIIRSVKSYLYGAVRNQALQYGEYNNVRERYRQSVLNAKGTLTDPNPEEQLENKELEDLINRTLRKLPERRRQIFRMHRLEGLKYKEIADKLSLSVKTIEAEMTKTYRTLREEVEKYTCVL